MNNHPTKKDLEREDFKKVWKAIKKWDLQREEGAGYANATGTDVMTILNALDKKEEKETLSFKIRNILYARISPEHIGPQSIIAPVEEHIYAKDVKEAVKRFIAFVIKIPVEDFDNKVRQKAKEIFGKRLIK